MFKDGAIGKGKCIDQKDLRSLTNSVEQNEISVDIVRFSFQGVITPWIFEGFSNFLLPFYLILYRSTEFVKEPRLIKHLVEGK